jgi:hypothetical protein
VESQNELRAVYPALLLLDGHSSSSREANK